MFINVSPTARLLADMGRKSESQSWILESPEKSRSQNRLPLIPGHPHNAPYIRLREPKFGLRIEPAFKSKMRTCEGEAGTGFMTVMC